MLEKTGKYNHESIFKSMIWNILPDKIINRLPMTTSGVSNESDSELEEVLTDQRNGKYNGLKNNNLWIYNIENN